MNKTQWIKKIAQVMCKECRKYIPSCRYDICESVTESAEMIYETGYCKKIIPKFAKKLVEDAFEASTSNDMTIYEQNIGILLEEYLEE